MYLSVTYCESTILAKVRFTNGDLYLRNVLGLSYNHKSVYRIYRELELRLKIKPKYHIKRNKPQKLAVPTCLNQGWSMDFMHNALIDGRVIIPSDKAAFKVMYLAT